MFICNDRKNRFSHVTDRVVEKKSQRPRFFTFLGIWILNEKLRNGAKGESEKNRFFFFENLHFVDDFLFFYKLMKEKWEHELFAHTKYNILYEEKETKSEKKIHDGFTVKKKLRKLSDDYYIIQIKVKFIDLPAIVSLDLMQWNIFRSLNSFWRTQMPVVRSFDLNNQYIHFMYVFTSPDSIWIKSISSRNCSGF